MNYNFTGSLTQRNINLGSVHEVSSAQLAQQARDQRAVREEIRARHAAATRIQSLIRGRASAQNTRQHDREVVAQLLSQSQRAAGPSRPTEFVQLTRYVAAATRRHGIVSRLQRRMQKHNVAALTAAEQVAFEADDQVLLPWAQTALQRSADENNTGPLLVRPLEDEGRDQYVTSLLSVLQTLLSHLRHRKAQAQISYQPYLEVLSALTSEQIVSSLRTMPPSRLTGATPAQIWTMVLVGRGLFQSLRAHIVQLTASSKPVSPTLASAVSLALAPFRLFPPTSIGKASRTSPRSEVLLHFVENILTITNLPTRIPRSSLAQVAVGLPVREISEYIANFRQATSFDAQRDIVLLANFVAFAWKRVSHLADGASVKVYLLALKALQDGLPDGILQSPTTDKVVPEGAMIEYEEAADRVANGKNRAPQAGVDSPTLHRLQLLASHEHISALLTASAKYPNSTREALCAFLASSLQSWDVQAQDKILACVAYRYGATSTAHGKPSTHSIGGLVRELWRGWIRGSKLARNLSSGALQGRKALLSVLADEQLAPAWPCLVILCQLYSRSLLTIGDDEFYPEDERIGSSSNQVSAMRNPLTLDEVVTLSGLLRNLAFAMYWFEGTGGALNNLQQNSVVGMKKLDLLSLRNIVTRLLQQLHQRDSRRKFAPENHWLMNSELDLNSFIQSVVLEEDELNRKQDQEQDVDNGMALDEDADDRMEDTDDGDMDASARPMISARLANHRPAGKRALTARNLAYLSPRLGVLNNIPFVIPFEVRVEIFHQFTALDYARLRRQKSFHGPLREITIRRGSVAQDGFNRLNGLGENLKHRFAIKFVDQFGIEESGIDGGGLFKEFLTSLIKEAFDTDRGLWSATSDQQLYPNPHSYARQEENLQWYRFLGRILGKALYQGILVDINFASFFLSKWLGRGHGYLDDLSGLESLDKEVYRNLLWLKHYTGDVEKDLALDFTILDEEFGMKRVHELVPNGKNIAVTRENRLEYIYRVSHYRLNEQIRQQSEAFLSGLTDLIDLRWLRMLNREELRILISGSEGDIDLDDLRANTVLGGYHEKDQVVDYFWAALASFTHSQRKAFLKFTTSCPSPPLLGFAQLNPKFGIRHGGDDVSRLPTASTCVNLLKLPRYTSYEQCREKLLYAIESGAGFDLS